MYSSRRNRLFIYIYMYMYAYICIYVYIYIYVFFFFQGIDAAASKDQDDLDAAKVKHGAKLTAWAEDHGKKRNVRTLLSTMHEVSKTSKRQREGGGVRRWRRCRPGGKGGGGRCRS